MRCCVKVSSRSALVGGPEKLFLLGPEPAPGNPLVVDNDDNLPAFAKLRARKYYVLRLNLYYLLVIRLISNLGKWLKDRRY